MEQTVLKSDDKRYKVIIWICCILYTLSVICKGIYASSLIEVVNSMKITKAEAGYVITSYYIVYAIGQIVFGQTAKRGDPALKIGLSLLGSAILLMWFALCNSLPLMIVIWGIHGIVQAVVWPSLVELQSRYLPSKLIESSAVIIASGMAVAAVISYVVSSLSVKIYAWQLAFYSVAFVSLILGVFTVAFFTKYLKQTKEHKKKGKPIENKERTGAGMRSNTNTYIFIALVFTSALVIITSYLRHGVTNWLPNMLSEVFSVPSYFSIIMTVIVAIVSLFGSVLVKFLHKYFNNYMTLIAVVSMTMLICNVLLALFYDGNMLLSVGLSSFIVMCTACINVVLASVIPLNMRDVVNSGNFSAFMNAFASVAVAFTTTLSGAIIDSNGGNNWQAFYNYGIIFVVVEVLLAVMASIFWKRKMEGILHNED